jgi:hypothetical protein
MFARYRRAVEKFRALADSCESVRNWPPEDPFLLEAYLFRVALEPAGQPGLPAVSRRGLRWPAEPGAGLAEVINGRVSRYLLPAAWSPRSCPPRNPVVP